MKTLLEQLQQLAPLAAQATAGPWHIVNDNDGVVVCYLLTPQSGSYVSPDGNYNDFANIINQPDAALIAAARNLLTPENLALLVTALAAPAAGVQWIEVGERLPEVNATSPLAMSRNVLVAISGHEQDVAYYDYRTGHNEWVALRGNIGGKVTHWMNLPQAPADAPR